MVDKVPRKRLSLVHGYGCAKNDDGRDPDCPFCQVEAEFDLRDVKTGLDGWQAEHLRVITSRAARGMLAFKKCWPELEIGDLHISVQIGGQPLEFNLRIDE